MALSKKEELELQEIESRLSMESQPSVGLSPQEEQELAFIERQIGSQQKEATVIEDLPETELGILGRAQFALEPIEANRQAFLKAKFPGRVAEKNGELIIYQKGKWTRPNEIGFSTARS